MKKLLSLAVVLGLTAVLAISATAQVKKGKTRALTTKHMMIGLVRPNYDGLGEAMKTVPANDKAWEELTIKAALLNEASYLLMDDGRCPDGDWAGAAKTLREGTEAVLAKIEARDSAGAQEAFKGVTASCVACHTSHRN